jgi:ABC-type enterochelin transport system ATPase subunit
MEILDNKLAEHEGASAIIVSHDMHLAVTFADVIIKIRKCLRPKQHQDDEDISFGVIDESCVYMTNGSRGSWTNGSETFSPFDFENYLRKK